MSVRRLILLAALALVGAAASGIVSSGASFTAASDDETNVFSSKADWVAPQSGAGTLPAHTDTRTIAVPYTAQDNAGGSGLSKVELYVRAPGAASFVLAATDTTPSASGESFAYDSGPTGAAGDGTYRFHTRAYDADGNVEATKTAAEATTLRDTVAPTSSAGTLAATQSQATWNVPYTASDAGSGLQRVELWVRRPGAAAFELAATDTTPSASGETFAYDSTGGADGVYAFHTRAYDSAGNAEAAKTTTEASTTRTTVAPLASKAGPLGAYQTTSSWNVPYTVSSTGAGLQRVELWVKGPTASSYTLAATDTAPNASGDSIPFSGASTDGTYAFYTRAYDTLGNAEAAPASADVSTVRDTARPTISSFATTSLTPARQLTAGETITFTFSEALAPESLIAGWDGDETGAQVTVANSGNNDTLTVETSTGAALPIGTVSLGGNYTGNPRTRFTSPATKVTLAGNVLRVTLGSTISPDNRQQANATSSGAQWVTPSAAPFATDLAGNNLQSTTLALTGPWF